MKRYDVLLTRKIIKERRRERGSDEEKSGALRSRAEHGGAKGENVTIYKGSLNSKIITNGDLHSLKLIFNTFLYQKMGN